MLNFVQNLVYTRPILESKDMHVIFQKMGKTEQNISKFGQKCTKFKNILNNGSFMHATITHLKQLKYALVELGYITKLAKKLKKINKVCPKPAS